MRLIQILIFIFFSPSLFAQTYFHKQWDRRFGGTGGDWLLSLQQISDHAYLLGGGSNSSADGDKTQSNWSGVGSLFSDYWLVFIDSIGDKIWDKRFGGTEDDFLIRIQNSAGGKFLLGGQSESDISGDKTHSNWDITCFTPDYWIVKLDPDGNKLWDKRYGGMADDMLSDMKQTIDGGYILVGYSRSGVGGDKTQDNRDSTGNTYDYWVVKIDSLGNKVWDRRYGSVNGELARSIEISSDGGYIVVGASTDTATGGDKTVSKVGIWVVKIDSIGNKIWDKGFSRGGGAWISKTIDGGFLLSGESNFGAGDDKSEDNLGQLQGWIIKTDANCTKQWDKTIFTYGDNINAVCIQTSDGCYAVLAQTKAGIGGYKSQPSWGAPDSTYDYWILKFCMDSIADGIAETIHTSNADMSIYPTLLTNDLSIHIQKQGLQQAIITISDMLGRIAYFRREDNLSNNYTKTIDLSYLPVGLYLVEIIAEGERYVKKVIKE